MGRFGLVGPTYQSQSPVLDSQLTMNLYPELDESGAGNSPIVLYSTPGTETFANLAVNPGGNVPSFDTDAQNSSNIATTNWSVGPLNPTTINEWLLLLSDAGGVITVTSPGWTAFGSGFNNYYQQFLGSSITPVTASGTQGIGTYHATMLSFFTAGSQPTDVQEGSTGNPLFVPAQFSSNSVAGNSIMVVLFGLGAPAGPVAFTDNEGNTYQIISSQIGGGRFGIVALAQNIVGGTHTAVTASGIAGFSSGTLQINEISGLGFPATGIIRGELTVTGRTFVVCGGGFVELFSNGSYTQWGVVGNDGQPVSMAASPQQLLLASAGVAYVFDLLTNTLTAIPGATFSGPVSQAAICDDFFILTIKDSKEFAVSAPLDATDWITNGTAIVSVYPDNTVGMIVDHREIWFYSDTQSVVYYDSGNIFPFDVIQGAFIEAGLAATFTPQQLANTVLWLGSDARGHGKVWMANGYTPQRVSTHAIEFEIQGYSRISDAEAWTYQDQGHDFYVLYFPTPSTTLVYDVTTNMWHKRGFWVAEAAIFRAIHARCHTFNFGKHLVGDWQSSKVYEMHIPVQTSTTWTFVTDDDNPIIRIRRAAHVSKEQKRQYLNELNVYVETGLGPQPPLLDGDGNARGPEMTMSISKDGGHNFDNARTRDCGQSGEYKKRVRWLRLGQARDFVIEIKMSDPIGWRIVDAYIGDPEVGDN